MSRNIAYYKECARRILPENAPAASVTSDILRAGLGKVSLEMIVLVANKLNVSVDQLLCDCYDDPTAIYLREIAKKD